MTRTLAGLLAAGCAAVLAAAAPAADTPTWKTTATHALSLNGTPSGALDSSTPLRVAVALPLQDAAALQASIAGRQTISRAAFLATYAPAQSAVDAVAAYLRDQGFTGVTATSNRLYVTAAGTAAVTEQAFHTGLSTWRVNGRTVFANDAAASVPSPLAADVISVLGLNDVAAAHTAGIVPQYLTTYNPQGFWKAYDATSAATGSATTIAIFTEGAMSGVVADLRTEEQANGLAQVTVNEIDTGAKTSDTSGADEWDMDTQYSTGMAGTVQALDLYTSPTMQNSDLALAFNQFAADDTAKAGSASFGECEAFPALDGSMAAMDQTFAEAAAQGQTVFASAGDTGGFCPVGTAVNGVPAGAPDVNPPASSPDVVALGGTTLLTNGDGTYDAETAWTAGGGGGPSLFEPEPSWQTGSPTGRGVPDVAMDADPGSGANVYVNGQPQGVGGTSLSSPLALGVWARVESGNANGVGFAAPVLYAHAGSAAFHDVVAGDTGPYPAAPGWDFATGLGSFDVAKAVATLH